MAGTQGCSGGWRPGAGRKPGATAIKRIGKAKSKKKKVVDLEPSKASVTFLDSFVVKKRRQRLSPRPHRACGCPRTRALSRQLLSAGFPLIFARPHSDLSRASCDCAQSNL